MRDVQRRAATATTKGEIGAREAAPPARAMREDPYLVAANKAAAAVVRRHLAATAPSGSPMVIHRKTSYAALQPRMSGNNAVRVFEEDGFHISIVDPVPRSNEFEEFHVTVENNTAERNAHFFYDDKGKYLRSKSESHPQSARYREDVAANTDPNSQLRPFDTLENLSSYASKGFLNLLESTKRSAAGFTGIRVLSNQKAPELPPNATLAQRMSAKPRLWTRVEAEEWRTAIINGVGAEVGTFGEVAQAEGGTRVMVFITVTDAAEMGQTVLGDVKSLGTIVHAAEWGKPPAPKPPTGAPPTTGTPAPTTPAPSGPSSSGPPQTGGRTTH